MKKKYILIFLIVISVFLFNCNIVSAKELNDTNTIYFEDVVNTGKDNGYSKKNDIVKNDPHYGWKLGKFAISGFSAKEEKDGKIILLKNVGDEITLYFNLMQDINKLDGNKNLYITNDKNGYDNEFKIKQTNFKKGALIIRKTDPSGNKNEPQIYINYLDGVKVGANTKVKVFEEGDYDVALDYEIVDDGFAFFNSYHNYRIRFKFSVRNGNCMIFPMDVKTNSELVNTSVTENGFYIDLANSKYLNVIVKKEVLKEGVDGLVEDTRFNRPAKSGEKFTEPGIYTIIAKNEYTDEQTIKKIYVGTDEVLKAHVQTGYSIKDIRNMKKLGAKIDENGNITNIPKDYIIQDDSGNFINGSDVEKGGFMKYLPILIPVVLVIVFIILKKKNKISDKDIEIKRKEKVKNKDVEEVDNEEVE